MKNVEKIIENLRGRIDPLKFKEHIIFFIFYQYLSYRQELFINKTGPGMDKDSCYLYCMEQIGYYIPEEYLFIQWYKKAKKNILTMDDICESIKAIQEHLKGSDMECFFEDLLILPEIEKENLNVIVFLLKEMELDMSRDMLGEEYMNLLSWFEQAAGKVEGEFYTPSFLCDLIARLVACRYGAIRSISDPTCGSCSLLLQVAKRIPVEAIYGRDINSFAYRLSRMNAVIHGMDIRNFHIEQGDTLYTNDLRKYQVTVANPPFSLKWEPVLAKKYKFAIPPQRADFAFVQHIISYMEEMAFIILPIGVLYRGGVEKTVRKWMLRRNFVDTVIRLPGHLFKNATIPVCILILNRCKKDKTILFIDATKDYEKDHSWNRLGEEHIRKIVTVFSERKSVKGFSVIKTPDQLADSSLNVILKNENSKKNYAEKELKQMIKILSEEISFITDKIIEEGWD